MVWTSRPVASLTGRVQAPGDKSCSHRALMFAGLAEGQSEITGLLEGDDVLRTGEAMHALGAEVTHIGPGTWRVDGVGTKGLRAETDRIDFGNSGTGSRLMMGVVTGFPVDVQFTGDASLRSRPMNRVLTPLRRMGLRDTAGPEGRLPFQLSGGQDIQGIDYTPPEASAQVKSAILLAGLNAAGTTIVREPRRTRDHTETMLSGFGVALVRDKLGAENTVSIEGGQTLHASDFHVPGDPSSAAFLLAAGLISRRGDVTIDNVMTNPTRTGFVQVAWSMAPIAMERTGEAGGEGLMSLIGRGNGEVRVTDIPSSVVPSMIDEFPIFAVLAAFADGETRVTGAEELRVKESDRISAIVNMLRVNGVDAEETPDGFIVQGCGGPPPGGGLVETRHDHRIAMSALVMGTATQQPVSVDDVSMIATSYPDFLAHMADLGADIGETNP